MQKFLFVVPEDFGFVSHRILLAKKLIALGNEVVVVTRIHKHEKIITDAGIKLIDLSRSKNSKRHSKIFKTITKLVLIYRCERPDIVHHFTIRMVVLGTIASLFVRKSEVVNTITGLGSAFISNSFKHKLIRWLVSLSLRILLPHSNVTVQNHDDLKFINELGVPEHKTHLILGSGVDINHFVPVIKSNKLPIVALPSRMLWVKGVGEFVEAARILKQNTDCRFVLVGGNDNNNPDSIKDEQLLKWQNEGIIEWWNHQDNMVSIYTKIDIVCLPTYREGLPKALLEAASAGLPIVTTDVPGCREVVDHNINGYLIPPKDFKALIEPLKLLIDNEKLRLTMGKAGREKIINVLSSDIIIQKNVDIYSKLKTYSQI